MVLHNHNLESISIVIPIHNEKGNIEKVLETWSETPFDVVVVDDGSTDSPMIPETATYIRNEKQSGYGAALKKGIRAAKGKWILIMDGDGQYRVKDAMRMINFMDDIEASERPDMVVCDRRIKEKPIRFIGRKLLNTLASILSHRWIPDLNSGCRMFRKSLALKYEKLFCDSFSFTTTITMMYLIDGYRVEFFPSKIVHRRHGKSKVKLLRHGWQTLYQILYIGIGLRSRVLRAKLRKTTVWKILKSFL